MSTPQIDHHMLGQQNYVDNFYEILSQNDYGHAELTLQELEDNDDVMDVTYRACKQLFDDHFGAQADAMHDHYLTHANPSGYVA